MGERGKRRKPKEEKGREEQLDVHICGAGAVVLDGVMDG
jgi:hypothetical protein